MLYILSQILRSEQPSYFWTGLKSLGYLIVLRRRGNDGKVLIGQGLADGA
jgi:hypothetical protein